MYIQAFPVIFAIALFPSAAEGDLSLEKPPAGYLLQSVVSQFPTTPILITGDLLVRRRRGIPIVSYGFELEAHWGATPPRATYTIRDVFGAPLEQLTLLLDHPSRLSYAVGNPLQPAPLGSLSTFIQQTDISWMDLTLAFLWWPGARHVGEDSVFNFDCHVIEVSAPPDSASPYANVRIWIRKNSPLMLQAEGRDQNGEIVRRLWVRSVRKIKDAWMIKDMEIQKYPDVQRTKLHIADIQTL